MLDEGNRATNLQFTFDEANYKWNSAYDAFWKDSKTPIDVYGYYPVGTPESVNAYAFESPKATIRHPRTGDGRMRRAVIFFGEGGERGSVDTRRAARSVIK